MERPIKLATTDTATAAVNTAVSITYTAVSGMHHAVHQIVASYIGAAPSGGNLKIEDGGGNTVFSVDIAAQGPTIIPFEIPVMGSTNTALIVTLAAAGASCTGRLNVIHEVY